MERPSSQFNSVAVFTATHRRDREALGESATRWLRQRPNIEIIDWQVTQSSDQEYHCITITIFYRE